MVKRRPRTDQLLDDIPADLIVRNHKVTSKTEILQEVEYRSVPDIEIPTIGEAQASSLWRIQLIHEEGGVIGLDLYDDVILGRGARAQGISGIDLSDWGAGDQGVSREHAILRPTPYGLYLVDIGSTNGTIHNAEMVVPGVAYEVVDGDAIVLGKLILTVRIVRAPTIRPAVDLPRFGTARLSHKDLFSS
jgi:hypothetical protein